MIKYELRLFPPRYWQKHIGPLKVILASVCTYNVQTLCIYNGIFGIFIHFEIN